VGSYLVVGLKKKIIRLDINDNFKEDLQVMVDQNVFNILEFQDNMIIVGGSVGALEVYDVSNLQLKAKLKL
jgi:hypothetical protein